MEYGFFHHLDGAPSSEVRRSRAALIDSLTESFRAALIAAAQAGDGYRNALTQESKSRERPMQLTRPIYVNAKKATTRDYARRVFEVASVAREASCLASALWVAADDLADTGLDRSELDLMCDVTGASHFIAGKLL